MSDEAGSIVGLVAARGRRVHGQINDMVAGLSAEQLDWQPQPYVPAIDFHLWHIARFADIIQATLAPLVGKPGEELWDRDGLHAAWGMPDVATLGTPRSTGRGMPDDATAALPLPAAGLREYARRAFATADEVFAAFDDTTAHLPVVDYLDEPSTAAALMVGHIGHAGRHFGSMDALQGAMGRTDSAGA